MSAGLIAFQTIPPAALTDGENKPFHGEADLVTGKSRQSNLDPVSQPLSARRNPKEAGRLTAQNQPLTRGKRVPSLFCIDGWSENVTKSTEPYITSPERATRQGSASESRRRSGADPAHELMRLQIGTEHGIFSPGVER